MTDYIDPFGSNSIPASNTKYDSYTLTADTTFNWPYNYIGDNSISELMEITCSAGVVMTMPAANEVSKGESCLIYNVGIETLTIKKSNGDALTTVASGVTKLIYVKDNSTAAGTWGSFTYGTGSSANDAAQLAGYGLTAIGSVLNSAFETSIESSGFTVDLYDRAKTFIFTGGAETAVLPDATTLPNDWFCVIKNAGSGILTIDPYSSQTINDGVTLVLNPGESAFLICTSTEWFEVGQGRSIDYQFTQLIKDVSAGGTITLSATEASNKLLKFIGSPAGAVTIIVPPIVAIYYVNNAISTAYSVTVDTVAGSGIAVAQNQRATLFCDSVNVLDAQTAAVSSNVTLSDGAAATPSLNFSSATTTGVYYNTGIGFSVATVNVATIDANGMSINTGYLQIPGATAPAQIATGAMVWDNNDFLLTIGDGSGRKTMVDTTSTQTLAGKTLTTPVLGVATATSINKLTFTTPATGSTLTLANGKTLTVNNTVTFTATDGSTLAIGSGGTLGTAAYTASTAYAALAGNAGQAFSMSTAAPGTNTTQGATTAFVQAAIGGVSGYLPLAGGTMTGNAVIYTSTHTAVTPGASNVDWTTGQRQHKTIAANTTFTFTAPTGGVANLLLKVAATGATRTTTWPAAVKWTVAPDSIPSGTTSVYMFYYDGTNYFGSYAQGYTT